jgi:hypothetical protein
MNKLNKLFLILILITNLYSAVTTTTNDATTSGTGSTETTSSDLTRTEVAKKLVAPIDDLFGSTEWSLFLKEFEMKLEMGICCKPGDSTKLSCAMGFKAKMIEPIGYMEATQKPLRFPFADLDLGGNPIKGGSLMQHSENTTSFRSTVADAHFIYLPIMGIIFKKSLKFVCFHKGELQIPYMSEFDPTWKQDSYAAKMIPHMTTAFTVNGLLSSVFDCLAVSLANAINGYFGGDAQMDPTQYDQYESFDSMSTEGQPTNANQTNPYAEKTVEQMNTIMNTMYFIAGCSGFSPVGGYVDGEDVIQDATLSFHGIQGMLHGLSALSPKPFLYKQTNAGFNFSTFQKMNTGANPANTMCTWKDFPLPIPSQYVLQLAYPTVGSAKESGVTGAEVSTAKNVPGSQNSVAYVVWVRRDYYAFAYFCGEDEDGDN